MKPVEKIIHSVKKNFFLKKHIPLPSTMKLLKDLYPTVDWSRVDFYEGLPWYTPYIASYVTAQALPQFYSFGRFSIYLKKFDESRAQLLADIVHEGMHIRQAMHFGKGYGFGILRGFTIYYCAFFLKYGYRNNPFEVVAHNQEFRFLDFCEKHNQHGLIPEINMDALKNINEETPLVFKNYKFRYKENYFFLAGSFLFCSLLALTKPLIDGFVFLVSKVIFFFRKRIHN
jgi:hypothetical protein